MKNYFKQSLFYRLFASLYTSLADWGRQSRIFHFLTCQPVYTRQEIISQSYLVLIFGKILHLLSIPPKAIGGVVQRALPGCFFKRKPRPIWENSLPGKTISKFRTESLIWLLILYPLIDYLMRNIPALNNFSGFWDEAVLIIIILLWPVQMAIRGSIYWQRSFMDLPILIYVALMFFLFLTRSSNAGLAIEGLRVYLEYLLCYFIAANLISTPRQWEYLLNGFIATAVLLSLVGIGQFIMGVEMPANWVDQAEEGVRTRAFSLLTSPNILGSLLVLFIPVTISQIIRLKGDLLRQLIFSAALLSMLLCLVFTYSRGAWLALVGSLILYCILTKPQAILALILAALAALKLSPGIGSRMTYLFSSGYMSSSGKAGRLSRWDSALTQLSHDPWFGQGLGSFGGAVAARNVPGSYYVDNFYLKTAVECGLIGLLALLWLFLNALRLGAWSLRQSSASNRWLVVGLICGLFGVLLHCVVENIFEVPLMCVYFWLLVGMLAILPNLTNRSN